jgi:hypothetical protein
MTTGRINQVTTFLKPAQQLRGSRHSSLLTTTRTVEAFGAGSFVNKKLYRIDRDYGSAFPGGTGLETKANGRNTLFPDLTQFEHASPGR